MTTDTPELTEAELAVIQTEAEKAEAQTQVKLEALFAAMQKDWELQGIYLGLPPNISRDWQLPLDWFTPSQLAERFFNKGRQRLDRDGGRYIHCTGVDLGSYGDPRLVPISIIWRRKGMN